MTKFTKQTFIPNTSTTQVYVYYTSLDEETSNRSSE